MKIHWIGHASFRIESGDKTIYFDPYEITNSEKKATLIFISHDHHDHLDPTSLDEIVEPTTEIIMPITCKGKYHHPKITYVQPEEKKANLGVTYEVIPAYNPKKAFHPKEKRYCGYVVKIENKQIFHAGDTDNIPEFHALKGKIDVAMLPIGDKYTMGFNDAIEAIKIIQPKIMIPMHSWESDLNAFKAQTEKIQSYSRIELLRARDLEI